MSFSSCPECGETNFYENSYSVRHFDCGFKGQWSTRTARCGGKRNPATPSPAIDDAAARYRLALLDAAQVADTIAADMTGADQSSDFVKRLHQLSMQMRAFAGHSAPTSFYDLSRPKSHGRTSTTLMAIIRKGTSW